MSGTVATAGTPDPRTVPLRVVVSVVGSLGLLALVCSDLVSVPVAVAAGLAFLAASYVSYAWPGEPFATRRKTVSVTTLLLVAGYAAFATVGQAGGDPVEGIVSVGPLLATLLVGVQVAHAVVLNGRRDLLVGLVIGLFMTVLAAGLAPGVVVALPLMLAWPAAVTAAVLAHRLTEVDGADAVAVLHRSPLGAATAVPAAGRVAAVVSVCVVVGLAVFLVLPQPAGISVRSRLLGGDTPDPGAATGGQTRSSSYYTDGYLDLRVRGGLSSEPVLEVPDPSPQLWRTSVLDSYDGSGWQSSQPGGRSVGGGPDYVVPLGADELVRPGTALRTDTVLLRSAANGAVAAPGPVVDVRADSGHLIQIGTGLVLFDTAGQPARYTVTSAPEVLDPATLRAATGTDTVDRRWTQLPASLPLRVRELAAQITAAAPTRYDAVGAVERYLRSNETYRLDSPVPASGEDAVDDFLFDAHEGFCEQFASAEVVLLRTRGIPARLATGFAYGQPAPDGRRVMLSSDAHAWVEVWYPGVGWSSSDPTAGAALAAADPPSWTSRVAKSVQSLASSAGGRILLALFVLGVGLLAAAGVRLLLWLRRRRAARAAASRSPVPGPVLAAFLELDAAMTAQGTRGTPAETLSEYGFRLPASARAAVQVLERECYGPTPPDPRSSQEAAQTFERLAGEVRATQHR